MPFAGTATVILPAEAGNSLLQVAELEFQAAVQLLADRTCCVSGALSSAIAVEQRGTLIYSAVSGDSDREPGAPAQANTDQVRTCLNERWTVRRGPDGPDSMFSMLVPIVREEQAVGFIELKSRTEFKEDEAEAVSRTAELVAITLEHRDAAQRAEKLEFREDQLDLPALWHAPDHAADRRTEAKEERGANQPAPAKSPAPAVRACASCGFPVSPGRLLCVECEQKPESAAAATNLFAKHSESQESWLSAHGYTIASLVVTAITAAIILWLRH